MTNITIQIKSMYSWDHEPCWEVSLLDDGKFLRYDQYLYDEKDHPDIILVQQIHTRKDGLLNSQSKSKLIRTVAKELMNDKETKVVWL